MKRRPRLTAGGVFVYTPIVVLLVMGLVAGWVCGYLYAKHGP